MKKRKKRIVIAIVIAALAIAWIWRYVSLNRMFRENYMPFHEEYAIGEEVVYGENRIYYGMSSEGYSLTVNGREIHSFEEYAEKYGFPVSAYEERYGEGTTPDAVVEVMVTIKNIDASSEENGVPLNEFLIHSDTWSFIIEPTLFMNSNPGWDATVVQLHLDVGESVDVVLPFSINSSLIPKNEWENFTTTDIRLLVTSYPTEMDVCLNT